VWAFIEAIYRTNFNTVSVFTFDAVISYYKSHSRFHLNMLMVSKRTILMTGAAWFKFKN
jgi:hypothetical protein